jgi:hypothetical protein
MPRALLAAGIKVQDRRMSAPRDLGTARAAAGARSVAVRDVSQRTSRIVQTIPTSDRAFREHVERLVAEYPFETPQELGTRLRQLFPRVFVRERALAGENPAVWYVYRDGAWRPPEAEQWWAADGNARIAVDETGWIVEANALAMSLLEAPDLLTDQRHFSDFVAPGTLADATALLNVVAAGAELTVTILLCPANSEVVACELHARREGDLLVGLFRLADDIAVPNHPVRPPIELRCRPESDVAFREYAATLIGRMPEPTPEGLALRLRRLYPHARVEATGAGVWLASRDAADTPESADGWWLEPGLPRITYDGRGLILAANDAAQALLGAPLAGRDWRELVTPGSNEQVGPMLDIIKRAGGAISRFRMPAADGSLVEFDSFTEVERELMTTVMRPRRDP